MDFSFTDWQIVKICVFAVLAFAYGIWRGFTGR